MGGPANDDAFAGRRMLQRDTDPEGYLDAQLARQLLRLLRQVSALALLTQQLVYARSHMQ
jgi:hypothetical protein